MAKSTAAGPYKFNSETDTPSDCLPFSVGENDAMVICVAGLPEGVTIPIKKGVGPVRDKCWTDFAVNGTCAALSEKNTMMSLRIPGWYALDLSSLPVDLDASVKVTCEPVDREVATSIPGPFMAGSSPDSAVAVTLPEDLQLTVEKLDGVQYVPTPYEGLTEDGICVKLLAQVECADGALITPYPLGYINEEGIFTMSMTIVPVEGDGKTCERADVLPLELVGPVAATDFATLVADALAANPVDYPTFGPAADTDEVLAVNGVETTGGALLLNGQPVRSFSDPDGVNLANTVEVPDGCTVLISVCLQKCLTKAEIAALP